MFRKRNTVPERMARSQFLYNYNKLDIVENNAISKWRNCC